ncbi:rep protein, partial [Escherichia coli]|nr:rep protein [Escherichia coli]
FPVALKAQSEPWRLRSFRRTGNKNLRGLTPMQDRANAAK